VTVLLVPGARLPVAPEVPGPAGEDGGSSSASHEVPAWTAGSRYASGRPQDAAPKPSTQSRGTRTLCTSRTGSRSGAAASVGAFRSEGSALVSLKQSTAQNRWTRLGSASRTTWRLETRRSSPSPASRSSQWWTVSTARDASNVASGNGSRSATARTTRCVRRTRWRIISDDGSRATTNRSAGS